MSSILPDTRRHGLALGRSLAPKGDDESRASSKVSVASPSLVSPRPEPRDASDLERLLRPVTEQLENQADALRQLQHTISGFTRRFEEEAAQADVRLRLQENFLRQHVENVRASVPSVDESFTKMTPREDPVMVLAPLEAMMARVESAVANQQRQLELTLPQVLDATSERKVFQRQILQTRSRLDTHDLSQAQGQAQAQGVARADSTAPPRSRGSSRHTTGASSNEDRMTKVRSNPGDDLAGDESPSPTICSPAPERASVRSLDPLPVPPEPFRQGISQPGRDMYSRGHSVQRVDTDTMAEPSSQVVAAENTKSKTRSTVLEDMTMIAMQGPKLPMRIFEYALDGLNWWLELKEPVRTGEVARLVNSTVFRVICNTVIMANAVFIVYTTNYNMELVLSAEDASTTTIFVELGNIVFLTFYCCELLLKMAVHRWFFFVGRDLAWNIFDLVVVVVSIYTQFFAFLVTDAARPTNASTLRGLRVLKLAKVLRVVQIMRAFNDLRTLMRVVMNSGATLLWSLMTLFFIYYFFSVAFVQLLTSHLAEKIKSADPLDPDSDPAVLYLSGNITEHFANVESSVLTLFEATFGGIQWGTIYNFLSGTDNMIWMLFLFFIALIRISIMNILTAVFVEHTIRSAQPDLQIAAKNQHDKEVREFRELKDVLVSFGGCGQGTITAAQFQHLLETTPLRHYLGALGLDIRNTEEVFNVLAFINQSENVDINAFVEGVLRMRGMASSVGQQNLVMEVQLLRQATQKHVLLLMEKFDTAVEQIQKESALKSPRI